MTSDAKKARVKIEFKGAVTLELPHRVETMSADDAALLGYKLIHASIGAIHEPVNCYTVTLH